MFSRRDRAEEAAGDGKTKTETAGCTKPASSHVTDEPTSADLEPEELNDVSPA